MRESSRTQLHLLLKAALLIVLTAAAVATATEPAFPYCPVIRKECVYQPGESQSCGFPGGCYPYECPADKCVYICNGYLEIIPGSCCYCI